MDKPTTSKKGRSRSPIEDLIKCFCGVCESLFKRKHLKEALEANEHEILSDENLREILKKFIEYEKRRTKSHFELPISQIVDCYELCNAILRGIEDLEVRKDDLEEMCFTEAWEDKLSALDGNKDLEEKFLKELMDECARRLGEQPEYDLFKKEVSKKLRLPKS